MQAAGQWPDRPDLYVVRIWRRAGGFRSTARRIDGALLLRAYSAQKLAKPQRATSATLLLVTHDLRLAQGQAERVLMLVLDGGRIVEDALMAESPAGLPNLAGRALQDAGPYLAGAS